MNVIDKLLQFNKPLKILKCIFLELKFLPFQGTNKLPAVNFLTCWPLIRKGCMTRPMFKWNEDYLMLNSNLEVLNKKLHFFTLFKFML